MERPRLKSLRTKLPKFRLTKRATAPAMLNERLRDLNGNRGESPFLYSLLFCLAEDIQLHWRDIEYIQKRLRKDGEGFILTSLPILGKALQRALADGYWKPIPGDFATRGKDYAYPRFMCEKFARVFEKSGKLRSDPCISSISQIYQIAFFGYKADDGSLDPSLGLEKIDSLISTEKELSDFDDSYFESISDSALIVRAKWVIREILKDRYCDLIGKHGPGATADLRRTDSRYEAHIPFHWKYMHLVNRCGTFFSASDIADRYYRYPCVTAESFKTAADAVTSKITLVPKDARGPRVIASEPWFLQFLQQGVKDWLVPLIESHPMTKGHVNFTDQSINQELVRAGSVTKEWSTLDLKDASDRVTTSLVYTLFRDNPFFLKLLMDTRSEYTETHTALSLLGLSGGKRIRLRKFAPMGSAMCFPILALCCFAISVAAVSIASKKMPLVAKDQVFVYGDDIVVGTRYASCVVKALEICGLKVNNEKSFIDSEFLESCGADVFRGHELKPVRIKAIPSKHRKYDVTPDVIISLTEKANLLSHKGYVTTASFIFKLVEKCVGPLPLVRNVDGVLGRLLHPEAEDYVCELNYSEERATYMGRRRGYETWKAYASRPVPDVLPTSGYGHLCRTRNQIGRSEPVAKFGRFDLPKNSLLKAIRWKPEQPTSDWVPQPKPIL